MAHRSRSPGDRQKAEAAACEDHRYRRSREASDRRHFRSHHIGRIARRPDRLCRSRCDARDIKYASIYDSFTITVIMQLEDLGFCAKGAGGKFVADGNLISGVGKLPFNTDGGGLCNNHPANRGSMTKVLEAVRQLRGEAHPAVQVKNAICAGAGHRLSARHAPWQRDDDHGTGVIDGRVRKPQTRSAGHHRRDQDFLRRGAPRPLPDSGLHGVRPRALVSACHLPVLCQRQSGMARGHRQRHIYTFSVMRRVKEPYIIAHVTLAEGPTMLTNIVACDADDVRIGQAVAVVFQDTDNGAPVPMFMGAERQSAGGYRCEKPMAPDIRTRFQPC